VSAGAGASSNVTPVSASRLATGATRTERQSLFCYGSPLESAGPRSGAGPIRGTPDQISIPSNAAGRLAEAQPKRLTLQPRCSGRNASGSARTFVFVFVRRDVGLRNGFECELIRFRARESSRSGARRLSTRKHRQIRVRFGGAPSGQQNSTRRCASWVMSQAIRSLLKQRLSRIARRVGDVRVVHEHAGDLGRRRAGCGWPSARRIRAPNPPSSPIRSWSQGKRAVTENRCPNKAAISRRRRGRRFFPTSSFSFARPRL